MNGQIFISYRREDASYPAGRLYDHLHNRFPKNEIFMDVDSLKPGIDFVKTIEERVGSCAVLIAVMGKRWLSSADEEGRRRLDNPEDFVRVEIGTALKRGVRVIPVLVESALMPQASQLPEDLKPLARRNALNVSHDRFRSDSERLIDSVGEVLEAARVERPVKRPAREPKGQQARDRAPGQDKPEALQGIEAGPSAPASHRVPIKGVIANLKRPRRFLVGMGMGVVVVVCLLGFGLFKATRPQPVSVGRSSSPTPTPLAAPSNSPSPALLASQALPSQAASSVAWLAEAKRYLDAKDYLNALPPLQKAADTGNADAMTNLGYLYENGFGVTQDYAQSRRWFQQAADAGDTGAMENLGCLYVNGHGVTQDYRKASQWYQKAADAGNPNAMNNLGDLYYYGHGVTQDYQKASEWYQKAADAGNSDAMSNLGVLYDKGQGVAQDYAQAGLWYQKAADKGNTYAKQKLSDLQQRGSASVAASSPSPVSEASPRPTSFQTAPSPTPSQADGDAEAKRYLEAKDYAKALPHLQKAAEARVPPKITRRASGTKRPPMGATQMRSKRSPAGAQSSNAYGNTPGIPAWITGP